MSTSTEISRLRTARNTIRDKLVELGMTNTTARLSDLAAAIDEMENCGTVTAQVQEGVTYTIPRGYHNGTGTVSGVAGGGNYTLQSKKVTPGKGLRLVLADEGYFGLSDVTVEAIPDNYNDTSIVTAEGADVLANKLVVDAAGNTVVGTMANNGTITAAIDGLTTVSYTIPAGYAAGGSVTLTDDIETALAAI